MFLFLLRGVHVLLGMFLLVAGGWNAMFGFRVDLQVFYTLFDTWKVS